jgi:hypothetical protein
MESIQAGQTIHTCRTRRMGGTRRVDGLTIRFRRRTVCLPDLQIRARPRALLIFLHREKSLILQPQEPCRRMDTHLFSPNLVNNVRFGSPIRPLGEQRADGHNAAAANPLGLINDQEQPGSYGPPSFGVNQLRQSGIDSRNRYREGRPNDGDRDNLDSKGKTSNIRRF